MLVFAVTATVIAAPASATTGYYGTCTVSTMQPIIIENPGYVRGRVSVLCTRQTTFSYEMYTIAAGVWYPHQDRTTFKAGTTYWVYGVYATAQAGVGYSSAIDFPNNYIAGDTWVLHGAMPYFYW